MWEAIKALADYAREDGIPAWLAFWGLCAWILFRFVNWLAKLAARATDSVWRHHDKLVGQYERSADAARSESLAAKSIAADAQRALVHAEERITMLMASNLELRCVIDRLRTDAQRAPRADGDE